MYALTEPHVEQLPAEPLSGDEVSCSFLQVSPTVWLGTARCKHGQTQSSTQLMSAALPFDPVGMVRNAYRQHDLLVACNCPYAPPQLNATVTYAASTGVVSGEQRIILETSAAIQPPRKNQSFYGRLTCTRAGAYYVDTTLKLGKTVASGARGVGMVFVAGNPPMLSTNLTDQGGVATAVIQGMVNLLPNQPLAFAYLNTGTTSQDVSATTLKLSEVWTP